MTDRFLFECRVMTLKSYRVLTSFVSKEKSTALARFLDEKTIEDRQMYVNDIKRYPRYTRRSMQGIVTQSMGAGSDAVTCMSLSFPC